MRHFQQDAAAGRVVVGAVVDVVSRHVGANAEVIVVGGVHDRFGLQFASDPGSMAITLFESNGRTLLTIWALQLHRKRHWMEIPRARLRHHLFRVHAGHGGQFFGGIKVNPGRDFQLGRTVH